MAEPIDPYALYRYFDAKDTELYIGKSGELARRDSTHIRRSQWMQFAVRSAIERYDSDEAVRAAERKAIETEHPIFNRQYNDTPEARDRLRAYLEEAGRLDLMPARLKTSDDIQRGELIDTTAADLSWVLYQILTSDTSDHAGVRLRALAALDGHAELPPGKELDRLAELAGISRATAYRARKVPPRSRPTSVAS